jgi:hypothetical protein
MNYLDQIKINDLKDLNITTWLAIMDVYPQLIFDLETNNGQITRIGAEYMRKAI